MRLRRWSIALFAAAVGLDGCGFSQPRSDAPAPTALAPAFKGSPSALMSLHPQASKLLTLIGQYVLR